MNIKTFAVLTSIAGAGFAAGFLTHKFVFAAKIREAAEESINEVCDDIRAEREREQEIREAREVMLQEEREEEEYETSIDESIDRLAEDLGYISATEEEDEEARANAPKGPLYTVREDGDFQLKDHVASLETYTDSYDVIYMNLMYLWDEDGSRYEMPADKAFISDYGVDPRAIYRIFSDFDAREVYVWPNDGGRELKFEWTDEHTA